jgi:hypothetical protein
MDSCSEPAEQRDLAGVANRVPRRVGAQGQVKTHDVCEASEALDRHVRRVAPFDAADRRMRHAARVPDGPLAEAGSSPSITELTPDRPEQLACPCVGPLGPALRGPHDTEATGPGLSAAYRAAGLVRPIVGPALADEMWLGRLPTRSAQPMASAQPTWSVERTTEPGSSPIRRLCRWRVRGADRSAIAPTRWRWPIAGWSARRTREPRSRPSLAGWSVARTRGTSPGGPIADRPARRATWTASADRRG